MAGGWGREYTEMGWVAAPLPHLHFFSNFLEKRNPDLDMGCIFNMHSDTYTGDRNLWQYFTIYIYIVCLIMLSDIICKI